MTADEAKTAVGAFVEELKLKNVTFGAVGDHYVAVTAGDLGLKWENEQDIDAAVALGKKGNILVLKKYLFGILGDGVFYMGEPDKYRFDKNKKW